jgi:ribosomal protein L37AE/L43A
MRIFRRTVKPKLAPGTEAPKCPNCGSTSLKRVLATHSVHLTGKLIGRRVDVYRVQMDKCRDCGTLTPTAEGKAKIARCTKTGIDFFRKQLR